MSIKYYFFSLIFLQAVMCSQTCSSRVLTRAKKLTHTQSIKVTQKTLKLKNAHDIIENTSNRKFSPDIKKYYAEIDKVDGWFDKRLIVLLLLIDDFQTQNKIVGNLGEIGVWQGKSFIPLMHLAKDDELVAAIDCFELYEFNRDNSGGLCRSDIFKNNIATYSSNPNSLKIIKGDSSRFTSDDYIKAMGNNQKGFRIFSIDGCHEAYSTAIDMENAFKSLVDGGVVIMDDYFHWCWPGVSEGVNRFMHKNVNGLKPFFIGMNKIFFAHPEYAKKYFDMIKNIVLPQDFAIKKFFDVEVLIYDPHD